MKRALSIAIVLLIGAALAAPTAQAARVDPKHTRYRFFQDLSVTSPFPSLPGRIFVGVLFKENSHGEMTPREAVSYRMTQIPVNCNPGGGFGLWSGGNAFSKYTYFSATLANGRFSHTFGSEWPEGYAPKGDLNGTVLKRLKRGGRVTRTARVEGTFNVADWDPFGLTGIRENCTSSGSYSASTCKTPRMSPTARNYSRWKRWKVPKCYTAPW